MGKRLQVGSVIPAFCYDTPYEPQKSFYELIAGEKPVMLVFLRNFGHPITRHYIMQYLESIRALTNLRLVCVVQSQPQTIAAAVPQGALPFELMCDADAVLYDYFDIPQSSSRLKSYSLQALKIIRQAQKEGYVPAKNEPHQLPLTLIVGNKGEVLFAHYGRSVTDLPSDCYAMERVAQELDLMQYMAQDWMETATAQEQIEQQEDLGFESEEEEIASEDEVLALLIQDAGLEIPDEPTEAPAVPEEPQQIQEEQVNEAQLDEVQGNVEPQPEKEDSTKAPYNESFEEFISIPNSVSHRDSGLPRGKIHYPEHRKPKALDFSELGFGNDDEN